MSENNFLYFDMIVNMELLIMGMLNQRLCTRNIKMFYLQILCGIVIKSLMLYRNIGVI